MIIRRYLLFILFLAILLLAVFFRFYNLSSVPPSPSLDEVSLGYNAYSILHTGKDEYGYSFPLSLRAYDDYRPIGYVYLIIPFIKLLGLNVLAVRLPSAIMSLLDVVLVYFIAKLFFLKTSYLEKKGFGVYQFGFFIPELSALLLAISPWHIYISRLGHEVNAGLFTVICAVFFFLLSLKNNKYAWTLILSTLFFSLSLYTYQSEKVFSPIFVLILFTIFFKELQKRKKILMLSVLVGFLVALPAVKGTFSREGMTRLRGTSAFIDIKKDYQDSATQSLLYKKQGNKLGQFIENRRFVPIRIFFINYFSHLKPEWLYANSGKESFKAPGLGLFYPWELFFIFAGILFFLKINFDKRYLLLLVSWIAFSFIAPAITTQSPHALRAFTLFPAPQIIEAIGIGGLLKIVFSLFRKFIIIGLVLAISISTFYFFKQYFYEFPKAESESFQYALQNSIKYALSQRSRYKEILFSNADKLTQSYMFYLFAAKYDPKKYLSTGGTKSGGFAEFHKFDSVDFRPIVWEKDRYIPGVLIVGNSADFPSYANVIYRGYYLDGKEGVVVVKP